MNSTETGHKAEQAAATYLEMRGYTVLEQNWRRPRCEIDIVAQKDGVLYLVEVKYRKDYNQGGGMDAITSAKLKQMQRSAWMYVEESEWRGDYVLSAIEVAAPNYTIMSFIENAY